jgi:hypothetical protein
MPYGSTLPMGTFQVILYEGSNNIKMQYQQLFSERSLGNSATIGVENSDGSVGVQHSYNTTSLEQWQSILCTPSGGTYDMNANPNPFIPLCHSSFKT